MQRDKAFSEMYNITFPENISIDNDYRFDITPESFADEDCCVLAVGNGKEARITDQLIKQKQDITIHKIIE